MEISNNFDVFHLKDESQNSEKMSIPINCPTESAIIERFQHIFFELEIKSSIIYQDLFYDSIESTFSKKQDTWLIKRIFQNDENPEKILLKSNFEQKAYHSISITTANNNNNEKIEISPLAKLTTYELVLIDNTKLSFSLMPNGKWYLFVIESEKQTEEEEKELIKFAAPLPKIFTYFSILSNFTADEKQDYCSTNNLQILDQKAIENLTFNEKIAKIHDNFIETKICQQLRNMKKACQEIKFFFPEIDKFEGLIPHQHLLNELKPDWGKLNNSAPYLPFRTKNIGKDNNSFIFTSSDHSLWRNIELFSIGLDFMKEFSAGKCRPKLFPYDSRINIGVSLLIYDIFIGYGDAAYFIYKMVQKNEIKFETKKRKPKKGIENEMIERYDKYCEDYWFDLALEYKSDRALSDYAHLMSKTLEESGLVCKDDHQSETDE